MNNDQANRLKQKKIDKHFDISVNGKKAKIINYKISEYVDNYTGEKKQDFEIITKISNKALEDKPVECSFSKDGKEITLTGDWYATRSHAGLYKYHYHLTDLKTEDSGETIDQDT